MAFIKIPTKGMRDLGPRDMLLREYVLGVMKDTYQDYGFELIETPCVEHIENLTNKVGGDNEKLIYKVLKRGEKLDFDNASKVDDLVDSGLRYDLTVPLTRFYANSMNELQSPFRSFQTGRVWRADRPQKGRYREFVQCDLDIFGEKTNLAEIELMSAVITFLKKLNFEGFQIRINDRRILKKMVLFCGFLESDADSILISLDKLDKIGMDGVYDELIRHGYEMDKVNKFLGFFHENLSLEEFCLQFQMDEDVVKNLREIMNYTKEVTGASLFFDPTLVRGMGYYTGPIFEIMVSDYASSIGGGGRYDEMVSKYANVSVPACGFSVGFERLIMLLEERGFEVPLTKKRVAIVIQEKNTDVFLKARSMRDENMIVKVVYRSKNYKHQKEVLEANGYHILEM